MYCLECDDGYMDGGSWNGVDVYEIEVEFCDVVVGDGGGGGYGWCGWWCDVGWCECLGGEW